MHSFTDDEGKKGKRAVSEDPSTEKVDYQAAVRESGGTTQPSSPNYEESDDVRDSIAEGYF